MRARYDFAAVSFYLIGLVSLLLVCINSQVYAAAGAKTLTEFDSNVMRIVVRTADREISGTGFLLNRNGQVITNYHVVTHVINKTAKERFIVDGGNERRHRKSFEIVWHSKAHDLAVVKVDSLDIKRKPVVFANSEHSALRKGMPVWTLGFQGASDTDMYGPYALEPTLKRGHISVKKQMVLRTRSKGTRMFEHDATVNTGISGAPLFDNCGRVIGINQSKAASRLIPDTNSVNLIEGTYWSIRSIELIEKLREIKVSFQLEHTSCSPGQHLSFLITGNYKTLRGSVASGSLMWLQVALFAALLTMSLFLLFLWKKVRSRPQQEGISEYIRREMSRVFKSRDQHAEHTQSNQDMELNIEAAPDYEGAYGSLIGMDAMTGKSAGIFETPVNIGRSRDANLQIPDERVGRKHAVIGWEAETSRFYVIDQGSVNGTWMAPDTRLPANEKVYLYPGSVLFFADTTIRFRLVPKMIPNTTKPIR